MKNLVKDILKFASVPGINYVLLKDNGKGVSIQSVHDDNRFILIGQYNHPVEGIDQTGIGITPIKELKDVVKNLDIDDVEVKINDKKAIVFSENSFWVSVMTAEAKDVQKQPIFKGVPPCEIDTTITKDAVIAAKKFAKFCRNNTFTLNTGHITNDGSTHLLMQDYLGGVFGCSIFIQNVGVLPHNQDFRFDVRSFIDVLTTVPVGSKLEITSKGLMVISTANETSSWQYIFPTVG